MTVAVVAALLVMFSLIAIGLVFTARRVEKLEQRVADLEAMLTEPQ